MLDSVPEAVGGWVGVWFATLRALLKLMFFSHPETAGSVSLFSITWYSITEILCPSFCAAMFFLCQAPTDMLRSSFKLRCFSSSTAEVIWNALTAAGRETSNSTNIPETLKQSCQCPVVM